MNRIDSSIRLLPFSTANGPEQMAADEVLLESALSGRSSVRLYAWDPPTLSLGYFQRHGDRLADPLLAALPWVRRATGGGAIVHSGDLTYAMALSKDHKGRISAAAWHEKIHTAISRLLIQAGIAAQVLAGQGLSQEGLGFLCFAVPQPGDVVTDGRKIVGGAQRLKRGALLQHGAIQVAVPRLFASEFAAVVSEVLDAPVHLEEWTSAERCRIDELVQSKYSQDGWNKKR
jgi:lipoate-protein ligase A